MLIKWIVCEVSKKMRENFSLAQSNWRAIAHAPGLVGQFGGWDLKHPESACILSLWEDNDSYKNFMENIHDTVTDSNNQFLTYKAIQVKFFEPKMEMPGEFENLAAAVSHGNFLRVADCFVKREKVEHFLLSQKDIWIPAISKSKGMLGGSFNRSQENELHFLVTTLWSNEADHNRYAENEVPKLREAADVANDFDDMVGRFICLEEAWKVLP